MSSRTNPFAERVNALDEGDFALLQEAAKREGAESPLALEITTRQPINGGLDLRVQNAAPAIPSEEPARVPVIDSGNVATALASTPR